MQDIQLFRKDINIINEVINNYIDYFVDISMADKAVNTKTKSKYDYIKNIGYDWSKNIRDNISQIYEGKYRDKLYQERQDIIDNIDERQLYIENIYGDIETLIEDDDLNVTVEEFLNNKDIYENYIMSEDSIEECLNNHTDEKLYQKVEQDIHSMLEDYRDIWFLDLFTQLEKYNIPYSSISESNKSISAYISIPVVFDDANEALEYIEVRFSDHNDQHYDNDRICIYYASNPIEVANKVKEYLRDNYQIYSKLP